MRNVCSEILSSVGRWRGFLALCLLAALSGCATPQVPTVALVCRHPRVYQAPSHHERLSVGESAVITVNSANEKGDTGLGVRRGDVYEFRCPPGQRWSDAGSMVTPGGDASGLYRAYMSLFNATKSCPTAPWFSLVGRISGDGSRGFLIGEHQCYTVAASQGQLECYANDAPGFYFNNSGSVIVIVTRRR